LKKILIIYPHFPPSNLAGVHRPRLFAQHLPSFGWEPIILTVHEKFYEEEPDWNLVKLLPAGLRIEKVKAIPLSRPRLIGDIGLRAFFPLYKKAKELIKNEGIDFLYIPIPSFYTALLGRWLHAGTGIKYGIDYIDPWVHHFPGADQLFSRHWFSTKLAKLLEPIAVKHASLITGVAEGYYEAVLERNPALKHSALYAAMPYGGESADHAGLKDITTTHYLLKKNNKLQLIYAGAMLPKAYKPLEMVFSCIAMARKNFEQVEFHFVGTGKTPNDPTGYNIKALAEKYNLWQEVIFEYPQRIPYLDVLVHLQHADGILILGSTEPHYTPSKTYQSVLSAKPIFAILHQNSTAVNIIRQSGAGMVLDYNGENDLMKIETDFIPSFEKYREWTKTFDPNAVDMNLFEKYSAGAVTEKLAGLLDKIFEKAALTRMK